MCTCHTLAERVLRMTSDPFFPEVQHQLLEESMLSAWHKQMDVAVTDINGYLRKRHGNPHTEEIGKILSFFSDQLSGSALVRHFRSEADAALTGAYHRGKREVDSEQYSQTKSVRKDSFSLEITEGMSEMEAIRTLQEQVFIAAGEFWDDDLQTSIRNDMKGWFEQDLSTEQFESNLKTLIQARLVGTDAASLGDSYFSALAHHSIVRTRTLSKFARGKELGAKGFKPINPLDKRTSIICSTIVRSGKVFPLASAQGVVDDLLSTTSTAEIKRKHPFLKTVEEAQAVVAGRIEALPPYHWASGSGCRTTIRVMFI
jgi:hypothetical protein